MSANRYISIRNAVLKAVEETSTLYLNEFPYLVLLAIEADQRIGSYYQYLKDIIVVEAIDCRAVLPLEAVDVLSVMPGEVSCSCDTVFKEAWSTNRSSITINDEIITWNWEDTSNPTFLEIGWELQDGEIVFDSNFNGRKFTILYTKYKVGEDGLPLILAPNVNSIPNFLKRKLADRHSWKLMEQGKITPQHRQFVKDLDYDWHRSVQLARSENGAPTESQLAEIHDMLNCPTKGSRYYLLKELWH